MTWGNFNDVVDDMAIIPNGTIAKVRINIKKGGYNDESKGWGDNYATINENRGSVYLNCSFTILNGDYKGRKVFSTIGLFSPKGEAWGKMGRRTIRSIIDSHYDIQDEDSEYAQKQRVVESIEEIDGMEFTALIEVEENDKKERRNIIRKAAKNEALSDDSDGVSLEDTADF